MYSLDRYSDQILIKTSSDIYNQYLLLVEVETLSVPRKNFMPFVNIQEEHFVMKY